MKDKPAKQDKINVNQQAERSDDEREELEDLKQKYKELEHENFMLSIKNEYLEQLRSLRRRKARKTRQGSSANSEKDSH